MHTDPIADPSRRRERILSLLDAGIVTSQHELQGLLAREGIHVNQATLSRDLRNLGVVKGPEGYRAPAPGEAAGREGELTAAVARYVRSARRALNQVVLRTPPGAAQPVGLAIDQAELEGVLGTIAGDDTVLIIAANAARASELLGFLGGTPDSTGENGGSKP